MYDLKIDLTQKSIQIDDSYLEKYIFYKIYTYLKFQRKKKKIVYAKIGKTLVKM